MAGVSHSTVYLITILVPVFHPRKAVATKCNVVSWDDQLSLFELAFEKYGAVDIVVRILLSTISPRFNRMLTVIDTKRRNH
jgi:hypothetical protein